MTQYDQKTREQLKEQIIGQKVKDLHYEEDDDYYVITLENGSEFCFRFMSDLC